MSWRLISRIFTMWVVCAAAIVTIRLSGTGRVSSLQALFTKPDGLPCEMPCMFGVRTGAGNTAAVMETLRTHPLISLIQAKDAEQPDERFISIREMGISAFVRLTHEQVYTLSLNAFAKMADIPVTERGIGAVTTTATLGDALVLWGSPTSVEIVRDLVSLKMYISLCYQREHFCVGFMGRRSPRISLRLPFYSFYATNPDQMDFLMRSLQAKRSVYPWIGAGLVEHYWRRYRSSAAR